MDVWYQSHPAPEDDEDQEAIELWKTMSVRERTRLWKVEVEDAKARAHLKAIQDAEATLIRKKVVEGDFSGIEELEEYQSILRNKNGNGGALHMYYFVTVNCKSDVQLHELFKKVSKYVNRKFVQEAEYVFEQRGSNELEMGKGLHVHILVKQRGDCHDGQFKQNTRNTFKGLVGNPQTHVDIRAVKEAYVSDKRDYMRGQKTGEGKAEKVEMDRIYREQNNIQEYYTHINDVQETQSADGITEEEEDHRVSQEQCETTSQEVYIE